MNEGMNASLLPLDSANIHRNIQSTMALVTTESSDLPPDDSNDVRNGSMRVKLGIEEVNPEYVYIC